MKILLSLFAVVTLLISPGTLNKKGVTIKGNIKNADGYFIKLQYAPFLRGNPSFEGFSSISTSVNKEGAFTLQSEKITNAGAYTLIFGKKGFTFPLFEGDNITFNFDANEAENTVFATGKGSGKINVLRLVDFKPITFNYSLTPDEFATETNAKVNLKLSILDAIYKKQKLDGIKGLKDKEGAERITKESPLNEEEFTFLKKVITLENYEVYNFVATKGGNAIVKTDASIFNIFNKREYLNITTQNYNQSIIYSILKFEYIKDYQKKNPEITAKEWDSLTATSDAFTWMRAFAKNNLPAPVFDRLFCEFFIWTANLGQVNKEWYDYLKENCTGKKCLSYIDNYKNSVDTALANPEYNLNAPDKTLNSENFNSLLEHFNGKNKLIVFWSAQYAGASVLDDLCVIRNISHKYNLDIVNICIDNEVNKKLWASRIINSTWKGEQYFMPVENNEKTLNKFSTAKINAFCDNGATYSFLDMDGTIHNNIEKPMELASGKIKDYIRN